MYPAPAFWEWGGCAVSGAESTEARFPGEAQSRWLDELRREIVVGGTEADRGEFVDGAEVFSAIRRRSADKKRAEERLRQSKR